ncbi:MFS transporter [Desulfoplanes formicivorans]|uniref:Major facilitator superfamily (MFS) profile domain-containing protein n=1 Tax=Desulfoplanes formicivorans TaxID=1592317 RepID=A0A194AEW9_9BACT|nr:MFS transporter [Desulfoplanes formicivorans]GAU08617.1 hypothetical protein DPF_1331 [Desulfoplanes formicivorans]
MKKGNPLVSLRLSIGILSTLVFVLTMGFNALLSVSTLDRLATRSLLAGYRSAGEHLALTIERGLRFKPLERYTGMTDLLHDLRDGAEGIVRVEIEDSQGNLLYAVPQETDLQKRKTEKGRSSESEVSSTRQTFDRSVLDDPSLMLRDSWAGPATYRILVPLRHKDGLVGGIALEISRERLGSVTRGFMRWALLLLGVSCVMICVALAGWIGMMTATPQARARFSRSLSILLIVLIGGTQLAYSGAMLTLFHSFMEQTLRDKAGFTAHYIERDFEYMVHKGVDVRSFKDSGALLDRIVAMHPELSGAALVLPEGHVLASAGQLDGGAEYVETSIDAYWPSRFRQRLGVMNIRLYPDTGYLAGKVRSLAIDLTTSLVISLLFLMELARLLRMLSVRMAQAIFTEKEQEAPVLHNEMLVTLRAAGFLFFLGYDMCISFIPLMARELPAPMWGISREVLQGMPISAEMICAGVALLLGGILSERFGWRRGFILGAAVASLGLVVAGTASSLPGFIAGRGISGFGFGLVLMAAQIGTLDNKNSGAGLAGVFAGIFAGSICGSAAGALLAERLGFETVLLVAAVLVPFSIFALVLNRSKAHTPDPSFQEPSRKEGSEAALVWAFLKDPRMQFLLVFIGFPVALCLTGFLYYMLPLMLAENQATQGDIGRFFMVYGLCFITAGPLWGRLLDRSRKKAFFAMLTGLLSGASMVIAGLSSQMVVVVFAVILSGMAQCLAAPSTMLCIVALPSAQRLGRGKTAGIYRTLERVGQVLGPILFGVALAHFGVSAILLWVGVGGCVLAVAFMCLWRLNSPSGDKGV